MRGVDNIELQWDSISAATGDELDRLQAAARQLHGNALHQPDQIPHILSKPGSVLASTTAHGKPSNDYGPEFIPLVHPTSFPYGTGAAPEGMSFKAWASLISRRFPRPPLGNDALLALDIFNVMQRHEVGTEEAGLIGRTQC